MKKLIDKLLLTVLLCIMIFTLFITIESFRLNNDKNYKPLIILDKDKCSENDKTCYDNNNNYEKEYWSAGYVYKVKYHLDERSSEDNMIIHIYGKDFILFNKFTLWAFIE